MAKTTSTRKSKPRGNSCAPTGKAACAPIERRGAGVPAPINAQASQAYSKGRDHAYAFLDQFALDEQADAIKGLRDGIRELLVDRETKKSKELEHMAGAIEAIGE